MEIIQILAKIIQTDGTGAILATENVRKKNQRKIQSMQTNDKILYEKILFKPK